MSKQILKNPLKNILLNLIFLLLIIKNKCNNESSSSKKISKTNILIPICEKSKCSNVYVSVKAFDGCYEWKAEDNNLISIIPEKKRKDSEKCFSKCLISSKNSNEKITTYLISHEIITNDYFRVRINFGEVKNIIIEKNFNKIFTGEKGLLKVKAYD